MMRGKLGSISTVSFLRRNTVPKEVETVEIVVPKISKAICFFRLTPLTRLDRPATG